MKNSNRIQEENYLNDLHIRKVTNGFILYTNKEMVRNSCSVERFEEELVFNTKDQLKQFIEENFE